MLRQPVLDVKANSIFDIYQHFLISVLLRAAALQRGTLSCSRRSESSPRWSAACRSFSSCSTVSANKTVIADFLQKMF